MKKTNIKLIILYLYAFLLVYLPDFSHYIKLNGMALYLIFTAIFIAKYLIKKDKMFFSLFRKKPIFFFIILNVLFTVYYMIRTIIAGTSITDFYNLRIIQNLYPILIVIGVCIVYHELDMLKFDKKRKYKFIINLALIQSVVAISMIIIPPLRNIAYNMFYKGSSDINIYISASRLYGFCNGDYTYSLQILSAFFAIFSFIYAYYFKEKKYYIYSFIIFLVTILNGRTGIIIYGIAIILFIIYLIIKKHKILKVIKIILITTVSVGLLYLIIINLIPSTATILKHAYNDITSYVMENDTKTETASLVNAVHMPLETSNRIFGAGYRIYGRMGVEYGFLRGSDIGFVNDLFMAGIFSILFLYTSYINIIAKINKKSTFERIISCLLIISIIISNIKGEFFRSQTQMAAIIILIVYMLLETQKVAIRGEEK